MRAAHQHPPEATPEVASAATARRSLSTSVLLGGSTLLLVWVCLPLWKPLLLGTVFAATVFPLHEGLAARLWRRRYLSAAALTVVASVLIVAPLAVLAVVGAREAIAALAWVREALSTGGLPGVLRPLPDTIETWVRALLPDRLAGLPVEAEPAGRWVVMQVRTAVVALSGVAFELAMMIIAFFFVLADGRRLQDWLVGVSPMGAKRTEELLGELGLVARSVIGANLVTGFVQASVATFGYLVAGTSQPLFFGLLTLLASFIPAVGTTLVSLPLSMLLLLRGHSGAALFLALWSVLVVALVDTILRPWLVKTEVHVPGAGIFFSMVGGAMLLGFSGLMIGPLALSLFLTMMRFHARDLRRPPVLADPDAAR